MRNLRFVIGMILCLALAPMALNAQIRQLVPITLQWNGVSEYRFGTDTLMYVALEDGEYNGLMPTFIQTLPIYDDAVKVTWELKDTKTALLSVEELMVAKDYSYTADFEINAIPLRSRDEAILSIQIVPFRQSSVDLDARFLKVGLQSKLRLTLCNGLGQLVQDWLA